jgi:hypothetical protein
VANHFRVHIQTVSKWRERFRQRGIDGLLDEPRPGQPRKITDAHVEAVISRTLESKPGGRSERCIPIGNWSGTFPASATFTYMSLALSVAPIEDVSSTGYVELN